MFIDPERDVFRATGGWAIIHHPRDDWEISLIRAAFARAELPMKVDKDPTGESRLALAVPVEIEDEALEVLMRVLDIVDREQAGRDEGPPAEEEEPVVRAKPTDLPTHVVASSEGLGEIVHVEGYGYELRVGPEPYFHVVEDQWEEFTDFSAQRQEFSILLEKEYEPLYRWLRAERKFGDFLRLVESTYRGTSEEDSPEDFLRAAGWMLAIILGIALLVGLFRWLEALTAQSP